MAIICSASEKPRVFITDSESWEIAGASGGSNGAFASTVHGGARPQTAEIIKTFGERCPSVIVNNKQEKADFVVVLDHEGGKGIIRRRNKVAVFNRDGDAIVSRSTRSLGNSVQDACEAIVNAWGSATSPALESQAFSTVPTAPATKSEAPAPPLMAPAQKTQSAPTRIETSASANTTTIEISSTPANADIELDGNFAGNTPSSIGVTPGEHTIRITKVGFGTWERKIKSSSGNVRIAAELTTATPTPAPVAAPATAPTTAPAQPPAVVTSATPAHDAGTTPASHVQPAVMRERVADTNSAPASSTAGQAEGTASITSDPDGADIFVDSIGHGRAPALVKLKPGKHHVQLAASGYKDWSGDIEVKPGSIVNVTGKLEK